MDPKPENDDDIDDAEDFEWEEPHWEDDEHHTEDYPD